MPDVVILLGAGASKDAGLPDVAELAATFEGQLSGDQLQLLRDVAAALGHEGLKLDVERLLEALDQLATRDQQVLTAFVQPSGWIPAASSATAEYEALRTALYAHIRQALAVSSERTGYLDPIIHLAQLFRGLDVFSLNYDTTVELASSRLGVAYTDGFDPQWNGNQFEDSRFIVRLHKLHGSLMWYRVPGNSVEKIQIAPEIAASVRHFTGQTLAPAIIYPASAGKDVHVDPYATLVQRFRERLSSADVLVCIGYSFRDRHIKSLVLEQMERNRRLHLLLIDPCASSVLTASDRLVPQAGRFLDYSDRLIPWPATAAFALGDHRLRNRISSIRGVIEVLGRVDEARRASTAIEVHNELGRATELAARFGWCHLLERSRLAAPGSDEYLGASRLANSSSTEPEALLVLSALSTASDIRVRTAAEGRLKWLTQRLLAGFVYSTDGLLHAVLSNDIELPSFGSAQPNAVADWFTSRHMSGVNFVETSERLIKSAEFHLAQPAIEKAEWALRPIRQGTQFFEAAAQSIREDGRYRPLPNLNSKTVAILPAGLESLAAEIGHDWREHGSPAT